MGSLCYDHRTLVNDLYSELCSRMCAYSPISLRQRNLTSSLPGRDRSLSDFDIGGCGVGDDIALTLSITHLRVKIQKQTIIIKCFFVEEDAHGKRIS